MSSAVKFSQCLLFQEAGCGGVIHRMVFFSFFMMYTYILFVLAKYVARGTRTACIAQRYFAKLQTSFAPQKRFFEHLHWLLARRLICYGSYCPFCDIGDYNSRICTAVLDLSFHPTSLSRIPYLYSGHGSRLTTADM
jgi:hypothetical protein